jgi:hypothetical protein
MIQDYLINNTTVMMKNCTKLTIKYTESSDIKEKIALISEIHKIIKRALSYITNITDNEIQKNLAKGFMLNLSFLERNDR